MKTLRYLLIVIAMAGFLSAHAQGLAQQPQAQMQSTSGMVYSGSTLPQAAATGTMVTGTTPGTYTPAKISRPRRIDANGNGIDDDLETEDDEWGETDDPWATPLGDAMWPLMALACAYALARAFIKKRVRARRR